MDPRDVRDIMHLEHEARTVERCKDVLTRLNGMGPVSRSRLLAAVAILFGCEKEVAGWLRAGRKLADLIANQAEGPDPCVECQQQPCGCDAEPGDTP
jgi:hypothetical protein